MPDESHAPPVRRMKAYNGGQGYVYQYYYVGRRPALADSGEAPSTEYIFDVSSDRKLTFSVSVFLREGALLEWSAAHSRPLTDAEQYGAVKMRLFQAFDEVENMLERGRRLAIDGAALEHLLVSLGVQ